MEDPGQRRLMESVAEAQTRATELGRRLVQIQLQLDAAKRDALTATLTQQELGRLDTERVAYRSVGRAFLLTDRPTLQRSLQTQTQQADEAQRTLQGLEAQFRDKLAECQRELQQLVSRLEQSAESAPISGE